MLFSLESTHLSAEEDASVERRLLFREKLPLSEKILHLAKDFIFLVKGTPLSVPDSSKTSLFFGRMTLLRKRDSSSETRLFFGNRLLSGNKTYFQKQTSFWKQDFFSEA